MAAKRNLSLAQKVMLLVFLPLVVELSFLATLYNLLQQSEAARVRETHAREVAGQVNALLRLLLEAGTSSVLSYMANSSSYYQRYRQLSERFNEEAGKLAALVKDNEYEHRTFSRMSALNANVLVELKSADDLVRHGYKDEAMKLWFKMHKDMNALFVLADQLVEEQQAVQKERMQAQAKYRDEIKILITIMALLNIALATLLALYVNRSTTRRLQTLVENTQRLASDMPLKALEKTANDEIATLDKAFRDMAMALEAATAKERAVLQNAADVICTIDRDGRFATLNEASLKQWGYAAEELLGSRLSALLTSSEAEQTMALLASFGASKPQGELEATIKRKDGTPCQALWAVRWSERENSIFCVVHDISERKRIDDLKRQFIAMVSHELRTPLTSVQAFLTLLATGIYSPLNDSGAENLANAEQNVGRVINLVNDILDAEKLNSGLFTLHIEKFDLQPLIGETLNALTGLADQKDIDLVYETPESHFVLADKERVRQILINLLGNAIKFSPTGSTISLRVASTGDSGIQQNQQNQEIQNNQQIEISVIDAGPGVPEKSRAEIFERYAQLPGQTKTIAGTGLGLAISKSLIERQGGTIGVADAPRKSNDQARGSRFWFTLPRAR
ncbi:MAG: PAS domain S-box protein [Cyanobacteria bacterium REEB67]|nr:PAS domain S-box protein [Cyanobacteria bacterium REEB67]